MARGVTSRQVAEGAIDLADPWYGGMDDFEEALTELEEGAPYIVDWIEERMKDQQL